MKLLLALFAAMLAIGGASFLLWRTAPEVSPCDDRVVSQERSPDGRFQAAAYERRCSGSLTTHVGLRLAAQAFHGQGDVFVAAGSTPARLLWRERELVIETPSDHVLVAETSWRSVGIRVRLVR